MRIGLFGAGGPAGVNVARALNAAGHDVEGFDTNPFHLHWAKPYCDATILSSAFDTLRSETLYGYDLVMSQPEQGLLWLADHPKVPSFIPAKQVIERTQHKTTAGTVWNEAGIREFAPYVVTEPYPDHLHLAKDRFGLPFWLRAANGAGARGATLVEDLRTAFHWIRYWETRDVQFEWIAEQYLPGRDFCWSSIWHEGQMVAAFARERLEWIYPHLAPSGRTGTPSVAVTVHDERVNRVARGSVLAIDRHPHGLYCVDLREDDDGLPRPTEINAGRFATTTPLYSEIGPNMADIYVEAAAGNVKVYGDNIYPADVALVRHIDCGHVFVPMSDL